MGGAQGFLLPELGSHFFHGSRAASQVCRAPRTSTALASSQRVVATELGGRLPGSGLPLRCAPGPVVSSAAASAVAIPFIALPCKLMCVSVRLCVCCCKVGNTYELVGNELRALLHKRSSSAATRPGCLRR